jgi:hypothetical protein
MALALAETSPVSNELRQKQSTRVVVGNQRYPNATNHELILLAANPSQVEFSEMPQSSVSGGNIGEANRKMGS